MKKLILVLVLAASMSQAFGQGRPNIFAPPPTASGPIADVVNSIVMAFNNRDTAYFQKLIAPTQSGSMKTDITLSRWYG